MSDHFSVDRTLIDARCSIKSFRPKEDAGGNGPGGRNAEVDFRGTKRSNDTHTSLTDPDARLYSKSAGTAARLCYMDHVPMENHHGLVVDSETPRAAGFAERLTAVAMVDDLARPEGQRITLGRTGPMTPESSCRTCATAA